MGDERVEIVAGLGYTDLAENADVGACPDCLFGKEGDIECSRTHVIDKHILFTFQRDIVLAAEMAVERKPVVLIVTGDSVTLADKSDCADVDVAKALRHNFAYALHVKRGIGIRHSQYELVDASCPSCYRLGNEERE